MVGLVRPQLKQHGFADNASIAIEPTVIRAQLDGAGLPEDAALVIGDGSGALPDGVRDLGRGVGVRCPECSAAQLRALEPLARSIAGARDRVRDDIWASEGVPKRDPPDGEEPASYRHQDPHTPTPARALLAALAALLAGAVAVGSVLVRERRRDLLWLVAITVAGAVPRLLVEHQLMSVNSYIRDLPWLWHLQRSGVPMGALVPDGTGSLERVGAFNLAFAVLVPPIAYAHARMTFGGDARAALFAALLVAACPMVIGFSASETLFVSSMVFGSLSLLCAERALAARRSSAVAAWLLAGLGMLWLAADSRPLNAALAVVVAAAALLRADVPRRRRLLVPLGFLTLAAAIARHAVLTGRVSSAPGASSEPPGIAVLLELLRELPSVIAANNYFRPAILPLWITALAIWGSVVLWRRDRRALVYLLTWFVVVFGAHTLVGAHTPVIAARYGLHSLLPVVFVAAVGLLDVADRLGERRPIARGKQLALLAASAAAVVGSTLPTVWLVRPLEDDANQEYRFLRELWARGVPEPGAIVVEHYDDREAPRYAKIGTRVRGGREVIVVEPLRRITRRDVPVYYYEGLPCLWHRKPGEPLSPRCLETRRREDWVEVASRSIDGPSHDHKPRPAAGGRVTLYRLR